MSELFDQNLSLPSVSFHLSRQRASHSTHMLLRKYAFCGGDEYRRHSKVASLTGATRV